MIGAPLTDVKVTLVGGRAHVKHTEGGDFRQAASRALRQGLMTLKARQQCQLLEPWYRFRLIVPSTQVGRALNDLQRMHGEVDPLGDQTTDSVLLTGLAPVAQMSDYARCCAAIRMARDSWSVYRLAIDHVIMLTRSFSRRTIYRLPIWLIRRIRFSARMVPAIQSNGIRFRKPCIVTTTATLCMYERNHTIN